MFHPIRRALTLVELLVIIAVLGFLLMLFLPEVGSREASRLRMCMHNQRSFALAVLRYEAQHKYYPGYANRIGRDNLGNEVAGSWLIECFAELDRPDLANAWKNGNREVCELSFAVCPSARGNSHGKAAMNYIANCGLPGDEDTPATGIFHNHLVGKAPVHVSMDYIVGHDGASNTLLLSENLQAGLWTDIEEANVGMVWRRTPGEFDCVNEGRDAGFRPQDIRYARPSSNHPGGVIASFCDGHVIFLSEDIDYTVYQHLMTPDSKTAGVEGTFDPTVLE